MQTKKNEILMKKISSGAGGGGRTETDKEAPGEGWKPPPCSEEEYCWSHVFNPWGMTDTINTRKSPKTNHKREATNNKIMGGRTTVKPEGFQL